MGYTLTQLFTTILWLPETKSWATACWAPGMFRHCLQVDIASGDAPEKTVTSSAAEGNDAAPMNSEVSDVSSKRQKAGDIWSMAGLPFDFCPSSMVAVSRSGFPCVFTCQFPLQSQGNPSVHYENKGVYHILYPMRQAVPSRCLLTSILGSDQWIAPLAFAIPHRKNTIVFQASVSDVASHFPFFLFVSFQ